MPRRLSFVLALGAILVLLLAQTTSAAISRNTITPEAEISKNGRFISVTGPIECSDGDSLKVRATVTQASTGAIAEGHARVRCDGTLQEWSARAINFGFERFETGPAQACALGITYNRGKVTDIRQWCAANDIMLVNDQY